MKNIRLFLQTVLFLVIVASAITFVPKIGQVLEGKPFESGLLQAPAIEHGHGEGHGEEHGEEQGEAHGDAHSDATTGHGDAVAVEAEASHAVEADQAAVEENVAEAVTEDAVAEEAQAVTEAAAEAETAAEDTAQTEATAEEAMSETPMEEAAQAEAMAADQTGAQETAEEMAETAAPTEEAVPMETVVQEAEQVAEAPAPAYPADLVIQPVDPAKATQAPVAFSHAKHEATELLAGNCAFCHHKGGNVSCTSAGCHTDTSTKKLTGATENVSFEAAFHAKGDKSCVGCHRTLKAGPTGCKDCHPK